MKTLARNARGFTLMEVLAATAMVAMLAGSLYASLFIAFKARRSAIAAVDQVRKTTMCMEMIEADLRSAMVPNGILAGEFQGQSGNSSGATGETILSFYTVAMDVEPDVGAGDVKLVEYLLQPSANNQQNDLVRHVTISRPVLEATPPSQEILCRGVKSFTLQYFDGLIWNDIWDSTQQNNTLPLAVEVTIELQPEASGAAGQKITQVVYLPCGVDASVTRSGASQ